MNVEKLKPSLLCLALIWLQRRNLKLLKLPSKKLPRKVSFESPWLMLYKVYQGVFGNLVHDDLPTHLPCERSLPTAIPRVLSVKPESGVLLSWPKIVQDSANY